MIGSNVPIVSPHFSFWEMVKVLGTALCSLWLLFCGYGMVMEFFGPPRHGCGGTGGDIDFMLMVGLTIGVPTGYAWLHVADQKQAALLSDTSCCSACGYDRSGIDAAARCPECNTAVTKEST